ncbi:MAG: glutamine synthetase [Pelagibacteraceae bacterium]|nr:glutamine synthetase [Pelagibacteraceae bacterium]|tara:strand:- start:2469 stop:3830 length:1362 start_codon:yes stop_codon:yes gene_type:complete
MTITFSELKKKINKKEIDTVLVSLSDMQGRLTGKRVTGKAFLDYVHKETHFCDYLYTVDMDMYTVPGYKSSSWDTGYGDMTVKPDLKTIKVLPWLEKTAIILGDSYDHEGKLPLQHSTRQILKEAIQKANSMGFQPMIGSELEFFLFNQTYDEIHTNHYKNLKESSWYIEDYMIFQTSKEEPYLRDLRNGLLESGVYVECTKGEAAPGQQEINVVFTDALSMADDHILIKNAAKEIAFQHNKAVSFMAKYKEEVCGCSCHIHNSLFNIKTKKNVFADSKDKMGMSKIFKSYIAGQIEFLSDLSIFLAPNVNSYKRFQEGSFAPTKSAWGIDNRTAGFRLAGHGNSIRIECRVPGSDVNPYLSFAGLILAGLYGIENNLKLEAPISGNLYSNKKLKEVPKTLNQAIDLARKSKLLPKIFPQDVLDHYIHAAEWEQSEYDKSVNDWEHRRYFERT